MKRILLSRTDSIGDVVLSIPMAGWLKQHIPGVEIHFLAKGYTAPILQTSAHVDEVILIDELSEKSPDQRIAFLKSQGYDAVVHVFPNSDVSQWMSEAKIPSRIGTMKRIHHLHTCNVRPWIGRKKSDLHESQLNLKLLSYFGYEKPLSLEEIGGLYGLDKVTPIQQEISAFLKENKFNLILHPRSLGSAREWGISKFADLIKILPSDQFNIILTGTEKEGVTFRDELISLNGVDVQDSTGRLDLHQLNTLIANADGLVAASTGPLHIAAAMGKHALGLFIAKRPMHPGRWAPVGPKAETIVHDEQDFSLDSIQKISAKRVANRLMNWL